MKEAKHDLEVAYYSVEAFHFCVGNFVSQTRIRSAGSSCFAYRFQMARFWKDYLKFFWGIWYVKYFMAFICIVHFCFWTFSSLLPVCMISLTLVGVLSQYLWNQWQSWEAVLTFSVTGSCLKCLLVRDYSNWKF